MKLALLKGNRFNPWHLQGFGLLPDGDYSQGSRDAAYVFQLAE